MTPFGNDKADLSTQSSGIVVPRLDPKEVKIPHEPSYGALVGIGFVMFPPFIQECVELEGVGAEGDTTSYVAVVCNDLDLNSFALILCTAQTAARQAQRLQHIEASLSNIYTFARIKRIVVSREVVRSYLRQGEEYLSENKTQKSDTDVSATSSKALHKFKSLLEIGLSMGASDLHLTINPTDAYYQFRVDGAMTTRFTLNVSEAKDMMSSAVQTKMSGFTGIDRQDRVINLPIEDIYCTYVDPYSGSRRAEYVDVRISRTPINAAKGQLYVGRIQPNSSERPYSDLDSIGLPAPINLAIKKLLTKPSGAFIVAGKVNCGKNTTLTACLERLPHDLTGVSIEDPIEYKLHHPNFRQIQVDGSDPELSMGARLTDVLRQDPNFISVAEMRTPVVAEEVIKHSRLGHLMFTTVHAADSLTVYPRLLDLGITENTLIEEDIIAGVLSQQLVPKLCQHCKVPYHDNELNKTLYSPNANGCHECAGNIRPGFQFGRRLICELYQPDETHVPFILNHDWRGLRKHLTDQGWRQMGDWAMDAIIAGELDFASTQPLIPQLALAKKRAASARQIKEAVGEV